MNKKLITINFLESVSSGNVRDAYESYIHKDFIHHNPYFKGDRMTLLKQLKLESSRQYENGNILLSLSAVKEGNMTVSKRYVTIDEYINEFPENVRVLLGSIRKLIKDTVPEAVEAISYQMPTFKLEGKNLVHFAGYEKHIGFYPLPSGIEKFKREISIYKQGKGSVQFPIDKPIPNDLIKKIVEFRGIEIKNKMKEGKSNVK